MPSIFCGCINPCNCLMTEDGFFANRPQDGRRNTLVSGRGAFNEPYVLEFQQSEFYRPESGEIQTTDPKSVTSGSSSQIVSPGNGDNFVSIYESPSTVFVEVPASAIDTTAATFGGLKIVGASATFAANATGIRVLAIGTVIYPRTDLITTVASNTQLGNASNGTVLTCVGFSPPLYKQTSFGPTISDPKVNAWSIIVYQNSGVALNLTQVKFWMTTI